MATVADQVEVAVREQIEKEAAECKERLTRSEHEAKREQREYDRLGKKADPALKARGELTAQHEAAILAWQRAGDVLRVRYVSIARERNMLQRLQSEDEVTRRLNQRENQQLAKREMRSGRERRTRQPRELQRKVSNMAAAGTKVGIPDRADTIKACQDALKKFDGDAVKAAEHLNDKKVPTFRGIIGRWDGSRVQYTADRDPAKGRSASAGSSAGSGTTAAKSRGAAAKRGNGKTKTKSQAKPHPKSAQAAGTSRGGTGKRGGGNGGNSSTTQAARSRSASKRSGKASSSARKPVTRRYGTKAKGKK